MSHIKRQSLHHSFSLLFSMDIRRSPNRYRWRLRHSLAIILVLLLLVFSLKAFLAPIPHSSRAAEATAEASTEAQSWPPPPPPARSEAAVHLDERIAFVNALAAQQLRESGTSITIVTLLSASLASLESTVLPWIQLHTQLGVSRFFIVIDGVSDDSGGAVPTFLAQLRNVELLRLDSPPVELQQRTRAFTENHWQWRNKRGQFALMVRQGVAVNEAIRAGRLSGRNTSDEWLFHLDADEVLLPLNGPLSLSPVLAAVSRRVTSLRVLNWEGLPESLAVKSRLREVTLFKVHSAFLDSRLFSAFSPALRSSLHTDQQMLLYGNGKAGARLGTPWLRQWGPHYFRGGRHPTLDAIRSAADLAPADDELRAALTRLKALPTADWVEQESDALVVLHYPFAGGPAEMASKARRACPGLDASAARENASLLSDCFVMGFDADVWLAAHSPEPDAALGKLFMRRVALPAEAVRAHLRTGVLRRERAVAAVLEGHERLIAERRRCPAAAEEAAAADGRSDAAVGAEERAALEEELQYLLVHA